MANEDKLVSRLTIDRAAFLLLRVKRAFKKRKQEKKDASETLESEGNSSIYRIVNNCYDNKHSRPAPLLRSKTLPAIMVPNVDIFSLQVNTHQLAKNKVEPVNIKRQQASSMSKFNVENISSVVNNNKFHIPRVFFADHMLERRKSTKIIHDEHNTCQHSNIHTSSGKFNDVHGSGIGSEPFNKANNLLNPQINYNIIPFAENDFILKQNNPIPRKISIQRSTSMDHIFYSTDLKVYTSNQTNNFVKNIQVLNCKRENTFDINTEPSSPAFVNSDCANQNTIFNSIPLTRVKRLKTIDQHNFIYNEIGRRSKRLRTPVFLFTAIEHENLEKVKSILESADVDINSVNSDGLSPLDLAVLGNNKLLIKMLITYGAREGNQFSSPENLSVHLTSLMRTAEHKLSEASGSESFITKKTALLEAPDIKASFSATHNNHAAWNDETNSKEVALWERRVRTLKKMLVGFDQTRPPDIPRSVNLEVTGVNSVNIRFEESAKEPSFVCTKFKVQWSTKENFSVITGEVEVFDIKQRECRINELAQGQKYFFRICLGNLKGYSKFVPSFPTHAITSSWRDVDERLPRYADQLGQLNSLLIDMHRPEYTKDISALQRRNHKKKTIKQLFTATSKFQKNLKRGVYFTCILYHEDKVLVTNEDFLPVIQIDEIYPNCIYNDFHWFMKVSYIWHNLKTFKQDMEKNYESSINHFRLKYLQTAVQMQAALCIQDLGEIYYKPIKDNQGTLVISAINHITSPKSVSLLNSRWLPVNKIMKKIIIHDESNVSDILISSIQNQIAYHQLSSIKLSKGLYLGYLKMQSSVDLIQIVVPAKTPNVLPHCKIRDNPHVSAEEWYHFKKIMHTTASDSTEKVCVREGKEKSSDENVIVNHGKLFVETVAAAVNQLFSYMGISSEDSQTHRLYDVEIIELTDEVSFLIVVPPVENVCLVPGTREILFQRGDLLTLPIQIFEMVQLNAYQKDIINRYSKLSCILELEIVQAQHKHREAFSSIEVSATKDKLIKLQELQSQMNNIWKGARWLIDVITFARDKGFSQSASRSNNIVGLKYLLNIDQGNDSNGQYVKRVLPQTPVKDKKLVKSNLSRGSWPGLNTSDSNNLFATEFSKSEQHLSKQDMLNDNCGTYISNNSRDVDDCPNKNIDSSKLFASAKSVKSSSSTFLNGPIITIPTSKSDDILLLSQYKQSRSGIENNFTSVKSTSASTSPQLGEKSTTNSTTYERSLIDISTTTLTNTTSSLSVKSTNSDSITSLNNDNYYTMPRFGRGHISSGHTKNDVSKSTASVAAMASISMDTHLDELKDQSTVLPVPPHGILQVYVAYETGLASGTSLKLHVTPRTTAREVVDLVVKQLNMAVVLKGQDGPIYTADELPNFCLVAVIGARERCLRDDFKPLQLQNPWKKGRLYVRQKQDVLAALEHSSKHMAYL